MAKFDIIFLFKYLTKLGTIHPIIHNDKIISIDFTFGDYKLKFRDSYLILLNSLKDLSISFSVETSKSIFPHLFVNENNLDYIGEVPDFKYFIGITLYEYNEYKSKFNNNWNLREELIKYCELDCISLYQVILKFNDLIFGQFNKNIHHYPTLPSLAFAIYRSNFMEKENIPQLSGKISEDIRSGYTGGSCDVFIPNPEEGVIIYAFDVNALYPYSMYEKLMPVGVPKYFEGNIRLIDSEAFGFFYCKIEAPDNIKHPLLQTHVRTEAGIRTISPIGKWEDMLFSEEMDNALKYGYKIEILWGYTFDKDIIFKEYVSTLHGIRRIYPKSDPMNYIAKILLNSLYGRFGMDDNFTEVNIIDKDYLDDFKSKFFDHISKITDFGDFVLIEIKNKIETENSTHNVSIGIASAITAYSRIHMSKFKNNPNFELYYTDTDSAYIDKPLPSEMVDSSILGKMKLENICKKAIFLAPKVYCLETIEAKFIYKAKGLKHEIELTYNDFEKLSYKNTLITKFQNKWFRNLSKSHIQILNQLFTLKVTDNKRKLVYNENNKLIGTKPYKIDKSKDIRSK